MASFKFTRRSVAVIAALVLALIATIALASYIRGIERRALRGAQLVQAFVAKENISQGMRANEAISQGLIGKESIPRRLLAESAIRSLTEIEGDIAAVAIVKGEQILSTRFIPPAEARGLIAIPADRQAMSVEVAIPPGVAGFIQAGDRVSILAQLTVPGGGGEDEVRVQYLLQGIQVLAVGQRFVTEEEGGEQPAGEEQPGIVRQEGERVLMTLAVTPAEAEKLAYGILQGQVYFTLLPQDQQPVGTPGRNKDNVFS